MTTGAYAPLGRSTNDRTALDKRMEFRHASASRDEMSQSCPNSGVAVRAYLPRHVSLATMVFSYA
jgi:hypothetical protein